MVFRDLAPRRQEERELRRLLDAAPQFIGVLDADGKGLHVNRACCEFLGFSLEGRVHSKGFYEQIHHPEDFDTLWRTVQQAFSQGKPCELEARRRQHDGKYRWFLVRYEPLLDGHGQVVRWYVTGNDIEDRKQAAEKMRKETLALREEIDRSLMFEGIVGSSEALRKVLAQVERVARTDSAVLILGETGTGKELIARAIHKQSDRSSRAFISVNCATIPLGLLESERFCHERGAFTGAVARRLGRFEADDRGGATKRGGGPGGHSLKKHEVRGWIEETGIVAAVRVDSPEDALFAAEAIVDGGIPVIEIALTVPQAAQVISQLMTKIPGAVVGAGGVRKVETAHKCLDAGAQFLASDGLHPSVVEFAALEEIVAIPGALTPTEVTAAWEKKSDFVKVVPCAEIGGEHYILSLHRMFPHIPLMASGGVNQQNASKFIQAGAVALGIGRELIPKEAIRLRQADRISELARRFTGFVKLGRDHLAARKAGRIAIDEA